jgi:hypothetical protein
MTVASNAVLARSDHLSCTPIAPIDLASTAADRRRRAD